MRGSLGRTLVWGGLMLFVSASLGVSAGNLFGDRDDEEPMERIREQIHEEYWQRKELQRQQERRCLQEQEELRAGQRMELSPTCQKREPSRDGESGGVQP